MEILVAFVGKVVELTVQPVARQFGYMLFYRGNVKELKDQVADVKAKRETLHHSVEAARRNCEEIEDSVQHWMSRVDKMIELAEGFYENGSQASAGCSHMSCPNLWLRHQLSKKAKKMAEEVDQLIKARGNFERVSFQVPLQSVGQSLDVGKAFESRISIMNQIMESLADHAVRAIGLYGTGGVGKTTLAKGVVKKAHEEKLFDVVLLVEVKRNSLKEIHSQIADMLGLKFDMQSESELLRASHLRQRLEQEKSVLVVLDDLWERLDLDKVGIPFTSEANDGFKVLLTSRNEDVLSQMNCERNIRVEPLSEEEAWGLFKEMAGINDDSEFLSIAAQVSQKCSKLPLAIVAVARALKNRKRLEEWKDALRRLKSVTSRDLTGINEVYSSLKLSYDCLENKELKSTFLLSAMFSQDPSIADLFVCSVGLGLLQEVDDMQEARDSLDTLVSKLKASSLLLDGRFEHHLTMHDVVRDLAISIASEERPALVLRDKKVNEWPYEYPLESCTAICLYNYSIDNFPEKLYAPKAEFFSLNSEYDDQRIIPSSFFEEMQELKVLNLTGMTFSSLSSSFSHLKKLVTLSLQSCMLEYITGVEQLKKLRVLNLSSSGIKQLPCEVGQLSCLQILNLSGCYQLEVIPPNILSNLKKLEELYMRRSFNQWEGEGLNQRKERVSLEELKHLHKLSTLEIEIPDVTVLPKDLFLENSLQRYNISIGLTREHYSNYEFSRKLTLELNNNSDLKDGVFRLLESVEDLYLENLNSITSLCQLQMTARTFCKLKAVQVSRCDQLKSLFVISSSEIISRLEEINISECYSMEEIVAPADKENIEKGSILSAIEFLHLRFLTLNWGAPVSDLCFSNMVFPKLDTLRLSGEHAKMMWNGKFREYHFPNVKFLYLSDIDDRAATFPSGLFYGFPNLKELHVECSTIEVIFSSSGPLPHDAPNVAPFTKLNLKYMNQLKHIWNEKCQPDVILQNLETLQVLSCYGLINLGPSFVSLANLTDLLVFNCCGLINLLTSSTARTLVQLTKLKIAECWKIEEVITNEKEDAETEIVFTKLKILELFDLGNFKSFCHHNYTFQFPLLDELIIKRCPRFKMLCPGSLTTPLLKGVKMLNQKTYWEGNLNKTIQQLFNDKVFLSGCSLKIDEYPELIDLWKWKLPTLNYSFSILTNLIVDKCDFLSTHVIPSYVLTSLINLQGLRVSNCDSVEVVFDLEGIDIEKYAHSLQSISLRWLTLEHLPKLKYVWNRDPLTITCFQDLRALEAVECERLTSIFPASIAKNLSKLGVLRIVSCGVEVIVAEDQTLPPNTHFLFPELDRMDLMKLPNLRNFYPQRHTIDCPRLDRMNARQCKKLKVFSREVPKKREKDAEDEVQNQYPLFSSEKVILGLRELTLNQNDVQILSNGQFQDDLFHGVYQLNLDSFDEEPLLFPYTFLQRFPRLGELIVGHSSFKELFPFESSGSYSSRKLQSRWNGDSQRHRILQNLASSSSLFNNLIWLKVFSCHGLSHLLTAAIIRSLVCLASLHLEDCKMMEEIVTYESDDVEDKIVLKKLYSVTLIDLPVLKSFCSQICTLEFLSLRYVTIKGCPKMKTFCGGAVVTPLLRVVEIEENEERWEENLNKTVENLFSEKEGRNFLEG